MLIIYGTNTYTEYTIPDVPLTYSSASIVYDGLNLYFFKYDNLYILHMTPKTFPNKSIIVSQGFFHKTKLLSSMNTLTIYYDRVYYRDDNGVLLNTIETYNGNGTTWTKISGGGN